jgi:hypothetical protein
MSSALPPRADDGLAGPLIVSPIHCYGMSGERTSPLRQKRPFTRETDRPHLPTKIDIGDLIRSPISYGLQSDQMRDPGRISPALTND